MQATLGMVDALLLGARAARLRLGGGTGALHAVAGRASPMAQAQSDHELAGRLLRRCKRAVRRVRAGGRRPPAPVAASHEQRPSPPPPPPRSEEADQWGVAFPSAADTLAAAAGDTRGAGRGNEDAGDDGSNHCHLLPVEAAALGLIFALFATQNGAREIQGQKKGPKITEVHHRHSH